ncbi:MAG: hypothetical protein Ta2B_00100 [Termitinemataceae bacterium]|nr:MAG: hypothetical protein Ta2B_00100 [Termitinemataceae bacterium]
MQKKPKPFGQSATPPQAAGYALFRYQSYTKIIFRKIIQNFGRFFAIFAIVALGVGFLSGLLSTSPDMKTSVNNYFDTANMMDVFIKSTVGLTKDDAIALENFPEVAVVQKAHVTDALVETVSDSADGSDTSSIVARIYGLPLQDNSSDTFVDKLSLLEGRFPQNKNECLVAESSETFAAIKPGTKFIISEENLLYLSNVNNLDEMYHVKEWTVTGIARNPLYISGGREPTSIGSGAINTVLYVFDECYALSVYTDFYITLKNKNTFLGFTDEYQNYVDTVCADLEVFGKERANLHKDDIIRSVREQTEIQIAKAEADLINAEKDVADGRKKLKSEQLRVLAELNQNQKKLDDGARQIAESKALMADGKRQLDEAAPLVESVKNNPALKRINQTKLDQYDSGLAEYNSAVKTIAEKETELQQGYIQLEEGKEKSETEFVKAETDLAKAEEKIDTGRITLNEEKQKLTDGIIELPFELRWYVLNRNSNVGSMYFRTNTEKFDAIAKVFPLFFLLLAILVVLTTMTRLVEEDRIDIGTLKALGYRKRVIISKYIFYCILTGLLGSAAGMVIGFQTLPRIFYKVFETRYHLPPMIVLLNWNFGLLASVIVIFCITIATVYACYHTLWENPSRLIHPRAPKTGKRIFLEYIPLLWNNMKFTHKVTARNIIRQKKHFFMTIIGIAGCTALMVTGFGLHDSIIDIVYTQFKKIYHYDLKITLQPYAETDQVIAMLEKSGIAQSDISLLNTQSGFIMNDAKRTDVEIITSEHDISNAVKLYDPQNQDAIRFDKTSVILTQKIAEYLQLQIGDVFSLQNADGTQARVTLTGITENYVGVFCYLGITAYQNAFNSVPEYKTLYAKTNVATTTEQNKLTAHIFSDKGIMGLEWTAQTQSSYNDLMNSITAVVFVLIIAAGLLAVIVLYNLTNINIEERKREISTLRVLGFHQNEAAAYIFREIMVLSIIGGLCGLLLGAPLHRFVINVAETPDLMFGRQISTLSFVFSFIITLFFSGIVDLLELKKIRSINMATSMKSVE